jgi:hypothetical protein
VAAGGEDDAEGVSAGLVASGAAVDVAAGVVSAALSVVAESVLVEISAEVDEEVLASAGFDDSDDDRAASLVVVTMSLVADTPASSVAEAPRSLVVEAPRSLVVEAPRSLVVEAPRSLVVDAPRSLVVDTPSSLVVDAVARPASLLAPIVVVPGGRPASTVVCGCNRMMVCVTVAVVAAAWACERQCRRASHGDSGGVTHCGRGRGLDALGRRAGGIER